MTHRPTYGASLMLVVFLASTLVLITPRPAEALMSGAVTLAPSYAPVVTGGTVTTAGGAAAAGGGGMSFASGASGAALGPYAVAAGVGVLIGWGTVESGLWDWATDFGDPVTVTEAVGLSNQWGTVTYTGASFNKQKWEAVVGQVPSQQLSFDHNCGNGWQTAGAHTFSAGSPVGSGEGVSPMTGCDVGVPIDWRTTHGTTTEPITETAEIVDDRRVTTSADCIAPGGGITTVTASSDWYAPGDEPDRVPGVECPAGTIVGDVDIIREVDQQPGMVEDLFNTDHGTDTYPVVPPELEPCLDGSCELELVRTQSDGSTLPCTLAGVECEGWTQVSEPTRTDTFECLWGGEAVPLDDCEMYWEVEKTPGGGLRVDPEVDSDLTTEGDRETSIDTATGTTTEQEESGCGGGSWLNPFSKLAAAVACALEWAFVPAPNAVQDTMTQLQTQATATEPIATVTGWVGWVGDFGAIGTGCLDLHFTIQGDPLRVIDSCEPDPGSAWLQANRGIITVIMWAAFLVPLAWWLWERYFPGSQGMA